MRSILTFVSPALVLVSSCIGEETKMQQSSGNMEPTIKAGEIVRIDRKAYRDADPLRWDIVVFQSPLSEEARWASRIVALPGETIDITDLGVIIDGKAVAIPKTLDLAPYQRPNEQVVLPGLERITWPYKLPAGHYFVLGDNVTNSLDSRYWGGLKRASIQGKVLGK